MDSLRYCVIRVPRRRLPLRPRRRAGARVLRRRPAVGVLRRDPPGPGALPGEAHRRAVGRRARRLPGRATSRCCGRNGTGSTATRCATSGAAMRASADFASRFTGSSGPLRSRTAATRSPRSTSSPRTTASRCATSSPTSTSTTRPTGRTTATAPTTTALGTAASRARPTTRDRQRPARAPAAQLPRHPAALPGRADAARRRRVRPHPERQQQRLVPGQRDLVVRLGATSPGRTELLELHAAADRAAPRASRCSGATRFLRRPPAGRLGPAGCVVVPPRRPAHDRSATGDAPTRTCSACS